MGNSIGAIAKVMSMPEIDNAFIIDFLKRLQVFRVDDKLPFGTCDYYYIDAMIDYLENRKEKEGEK